MADVLFFDYWTKGIRHVLPTARALEKAGISCMLLHVGSTRERDVPAEETIDGLLCRDIQYYGGSLIRAFDAESPRVVMLLNMQTEDRIMVRLCRATGAKSVFLMHGIYPDAEDLAASSRLSDSAFGVRGRLLRVPKYLRLFRDYTNAFWRESIREGLNLSNYAYFLRVAYSPGDTYVQRWVHKDGFADRALVYGNAYRRLFVDALGYPPEHVTVVGNYNLDSLFRFARKPGAADEAERYLQQIGVPPHRGKRAIVFMEGGYTHPTNTPSGWSTQSVIAEAIGVANCARKAGLHLVVKLHPVTNPAPFVEALGSRDDVTVVQHCDTHKLVFGTIATLGFTSSTLMLPIACGRPLIIVSFPPHVSDLQYYLRHNIAMHARSESELTTLLLEITERPYVLPPARIKYIEDYITYDDGESEARIASEIIAQWKAAEPAN
jgi:hypothetical protein